MKTIKTNQFQQPSPEPSPDPGKMTYNAIIQKYPVISEWVEWFNQNQHERKVGIVKFKDALSSMGINTSQIPELAVIVMN